MLRRELVAAREPFGSCPAPGTPASLWLDHDEEEPCASVAEAEDNDRLRRIPSARADRMLEC